MRAHRLASCAIGAVLALAACTGAPDPAVDEAPDPVDSDVGVGAGIGGGTSPDRTQERLNAAVDELMTSPSVNLRIHASRGPVFNGRAETATLTADWFPADEVTFGVLRHLIPGVHRALLTQWLVVDGRAYERGSTTTNFTGHWLDVTKSLRNEAGLPAGWPSTDLLESIEASSVTGAGRTTTIVGQVPTDNVIKTLGLGDDLLLPSVREALAGGTTMVTVRIVDGLPVTLSLYGRDVGLPATGVPTTSLVYLEPAFAEWRFSPGARTEAPTAPPRHQVDRMVDY